MFGVVTTQVMLPLLRRSDAGRIVNLSSGLGSLTRNRDPAWEFASVKYLAYNSSKTAVKRSAASVTGSRAAPACCAMAP